MNNTYSSNFKFTQLDNIISKIIIKICLNVENKSRYPLALDLIREETRKIIIVSVLVQFRIVFSSLGEVYKENTNNKTLIDIFIKILLLSSKQKVATRLSVLNLRPYTRLDSFNSWFLEDIKLEEYNLFTIILNNIKISSEKKNSVLFTGSLIENLTLKLSDIIVYELFYESRLSLVFFVEYTTNFLIFKSHIRSLKFYSYWRKFLDKKNIFLKKTYPFSYPILIWTRKGFLLKYLHPNHKLISLNVN